MIRILNCSNNPESDYTKEHGYLDSDIIVLLKENARIFECKFVNRNGDILLTNNIFPLENRDVGIPKIQIIDYLETSDEYKYKNDQIVNSALIADHVVFTTQSLKDLFKKFYPDIKLKNSSVIDNTNKLIVIKNYYKIITELCGKKEEPVSDKETRISWKRNKK